ncbi:MAG TPA: hypothetical protein PKE40_07120 [Arachnia sp.]|nr:hypothetical protein [Arachnia sp.]HMT86105.1 hypothetical protein [Arachnia sp.]
MRLRVLLTVLLSLLLWLPGAVVHADDGIAWTVAAGDDGSRRANFAYEVAPGGRVEDTWVVGNAGTEKLTLQVYAADAFTTTSGDLDLVPGGEVSEGVGVWVQPSVTELVLAPGDEKEVTFALEVPADAAPGDYAGGIVSVLTEDADATLQIERRLGTRIHVRVPGDLVTSLAVTDLSVTAPSAWNPFAPLELAVSYRAVNDGTARVFGSPRVTASGPGGLGAVSVDDEVPEVLPGGAIDKALALPGVWALGPTTVRVEVTPQGIDGQAGPVAVTETTLWLVPWGWVALLGLAALAGFVVGVVRYRRRWEWVDEETPEAAEAETLVAPQ